MLHIYSYIIWPIAVLIDLLNFFKAGLLSASLLVVGLLISVSHRPVSLRFVWLPVAGLYTVVWKRVGKQ